MKVRVLLAAAATLGSTCLSVLIGAPAAHADRLQCNWSPNTGSQVPGIGYVEGPYNSYNLYNGDSSSCGKTGATVVKGAQIKIYCHENNGNADWVWFSPYPGIKGWTSRSNVGSYSPAVPKCENFT
ncbi:hypothetical protein [Nocardia sp. NPDC056000]|uniref:hypothetical protein n=1 Tax=Nocardia sp. NPDC056000 TaxID=3345674 RepID=UPI0035DF0C9B